MDDRTQILKYMVSTAGKLCFNNTVLLFKYVLNEFSIDLLGLRRIYLDKQTFLSFSFCDCQSSFNQVLAIVVVCCHCNWDHLCVMSRFVKFKYSLKSNECSAMLLFVSRVGTGTKYQQFFVRVQVVDMPSRTQTDW